MRRLAVAVAGLAALAADLPWGDWQGHSHWARIGWIPFVSAPVRVADIVLNMLMFAPLGWLTTLERRRVSPLAAGLITAVLGLIGEWSQLYSHSRFPSATDLTCNVLGAMIGSVLPRFWRPQRDE